MTVVDSAVREFSITLYPPTTFNTIFLCVALATLLAASTWLGMRFYLHLFGVKADGKVTESLQTRSLVKSSGEFSASRFVSTDDLKIDFTGPNGVKHTVKGTHYSNKDDKGPQVDGTVQVLYSKTNPDFAIYYDPVWHYIVPLVSLVIALLLTYAATRSCHEDLRVMNALSLGDSMREHFEEYNNVIIESNFTVHDNPNDAAAYEQRGDAQFAIVQFGDAIKDYSEALRLRPDGRELLLKRAKAEWLDGRDSDALRDWLKYR